MATAAGKTALQANARHMPELTDCMQPKAAQMQAILRVQTQGFNGQRREGFGHNPLLRCYHKRGFALHLPITSQSMGPAPGSGERYTGLKPQFLQGQDNIGEKRLFTAKKPGAAGDIKDKAIIAVHSHPGRKTVGPAGKSGKRFCIGLAE